MLCQDQNKGQSFIGINRGRNTISEFMPRFSAKGSILFHRTKLPSLLHREIG